MRRKKSLLGIIIFSAMSALSVYYAQGGKPGETKAIVTRVVDGDTIVVMLNGAKTKVRLQGVNTPEKDGPYTKAQPMNQTATRRTKELVENKTVTLLSGGSDETDKYGRLLAYVVLEDGRVLNEILIKEGLAEVYRKFHYSEKGRYLILEAEAKATCKGVWKRKEPSCKRWG
ncbi:MAG: thermonuclease family protein [Nitrospinae bacterium]|nr:thermonuclease family protein [Nitrospinota bacterium]